MTKNKQIDKRVLFHNAVSQKDLWKYLGACDIRMITIPPVTKSYYFMLPNKLFECIQSELPIIASDLPEIKKIVNKYDIGELYDSNDINDIGEKIDKLTHDRIKYKKYKKNTQDAKKELCWENEKEILKKEIIKYI